MIDQVPLSYYLLLGAILFTIGAGGVLIRRNVIVILMCLEIMMNAVNLTFIAFSSFLDSATGQIFVLMIMAVAAVEIAIGLALLVELNRRKQINLAESNLPGLSYLQSSNLHHYLLATFIGVLVMVSYFFLR